MNSKWKASCSKLFFFDLRKNKLLSFGRQIISYWILLCNLIHFFFFFLPCNMLYCFLGFGTWELGHVIRCDNENTSYHTDAISKRKSVITLLQRPDMGSDTSKLSYRFVCKTSCAGGMQRRPIIVIFTLEDEMFVQYITYQVCAPV